MNDLVRSVLARRPWVTDRTLLDCLELAEWLGPRIRAGLTPLLTTAELESRWTCDQSTVSRRISALREHGLLDADLQAGAGAYWQVRRVGPTA